MAARILIVALVLVSLLYLSHTTAYSDAKVATSETCNTIDRQGVKELVDIFAHEALGGRGTMQPGFDVAGTIIARELRTAGLKTLPGLHGSYFQEFKFTYGSREGKFSSRNVLGYIPGTGSKEEYIILGAHYDHLGTNIEGDKKVVYPGADDNASGTAAAIALARSFGEMSHAGFKPKRNIVFALWGAEEFGMKGSDHFIQQKTVTLENIMAVINLDMVGRNDPRLLFAIGSPEDTEFSKVSPELAALVVEKNGKLPKPFTIKYSHRAFCCSDHRPFFSIGIPVIFLTTDSHDDFHKPTDTPEKINEDKIGDIACLTKHMILRLATSDLQPTLVQPFAKDHR